MNEASYVADYEDLADMSLPDIARSEKVVIFASGLTDTRMIVKFLTDRGTPFRVIDGHGELAQPSGLQAFVRDDELAFVAADFR